MGDLKAASEKLMKAMPGLAYKESVLCHGYAGMLAAARWEAGKLTPQHQTAKIQRASALKMLKRALDLDKYSV